MPFPLNVLFAGCARNCEPYLDLIENNLLQVSGLFSSADLLVFENDSTDQTKARLRSFLPTARSRRVIHADGLFRALPSRTLRLAFGRNALADLIRARAYEHVDIVILLDLDDVNTDPPRLDVIERTIVAMLGDYTWGASFSNTDGVYYDLWALRHPQICPGDVWLDAETLRMRELLPVEEAYRRVFENRIFTIPSHFPEIEVESAFGGFGIYKSSLFKHTRARYIGEQTQLLSLGREDRLIHYQCCEHVPFHATLRAELGCKLKIVPSLINRKGTYPAFNPHSMTALKIDEYSID